MYCRPGRFRDLITLQFGVSLALGVPFPLPCVEKEKCNSKERCRCPNFFTLNDFEVEAQERKSTSVSIVAPLKFEPFAGWNGDAEPMRKTLESLHHIENKHHRRQFSLESSWLDAEKPFATLLNENDFLLLSPARTFVNLNDHKSLDELYLSSFNANCVVILVADEVKEKNDPWNQYRDILLWTLSVTEFWRYRRTYEQRLEVSQELQWTFRYDGRDRTDARLRGKIELDIEDLDGVPVLRQKERCF